VTIVVTAGRTGVMTGATGGTIAAIAVAGPGCCVDSCMRGLTAKPIALLPLSGTTELIGR
jgi:hypothetical protein